MLLPLPLIAITETVYATPLVKPFIVIGEFSLDPVIAFEPSVLHITVYNTIGDPPLFDGGVKLTIKLRFPGTISPRIGGLGNKPIIEPEIDIPEFSWPAVLFGNNTVDPILIPLFVMTKLLFWDGFV